LEIKMPAGKGRYTIGAKGTHGCKGFPVVGGEGKVHGCHPTRGAAMRQQAAIYASENQNSKAVEALDILKFHDEYEQTWKLYKNDNDEFVIENEMGIKKYTGTDESIARSLVDEHNKLIDNEMIKSLWDGSPFYIGKSNG
jgi:hypothetical protein